MNQIIFKGEGGANIVVQYKNSKKLAHVIRLRKGRLNGIEELEIASIDEIIWPELRQQGASLITLQSDLQYIKEFLHPFIGYQYIPPQVKPLLSTKYLYSVSRPPICAFD